MSAAEGVAFAALVLVDGAAILITLRFAALALGVVVSALWTFFVSPVFAGVSNEQYLAFFVAPVTAAVGGGVVAVGVDSFVSGKVRDELSEIRVADGLLLGGVGFLLVAGFLSIVFLSQRSASSLTFAVARSLTERRDFETTRSAIVKQRRMIEERFDERWRRWIVAMALLSVLVEASNYLFQTPRYWVVSGVFSASMWASMSFFWLGLKLEHRLKFVAYSRWTAAIDAAEAEDIADKAAQFAPLRDALDGNAISLRVSRATGIALAAIALASVRFALGRQRTHPTD